MTDFRAAAQRVLDISTELLRLYDWRSEVGGAITNKQAVKYGREKKSAWEALRHALADLRSALQQPVDALQRAWMENSCGDSDCEEFRRRAAIRVLTGGKTHREWAALLNEEVDALEKLRANPMPIPPNCDHPERPEGKPLCHACWDAYRPEFEAWSARRSTSALAQPQGQDALLERLREANSLLRSAASIAAHEGLQTNWQAFASRVKKELQAEHSLMVTDHAKICGDPECIAASPPDSAPQPQMSEWRVWGSCPYLEIREGLGRYEFRDGNGIVYSLDKTRTDGDLGGGFTLAQLMADAPNMKSWGGRNHAAWADSAPQPEETTIYSTTAIEVPCPPHRFQPDASRSWQCAFTYDSGGAIAHCMNIEANAIHIPDSSQRPMTMERNGTPDADFGPRYAFDGPYIVRDDARGDWMMVRDVEAIIDGIIRAYPPAVTQPKDDERCAFMRIDSTPCDCPPIDCVHDQDMYGREVEGGTHPFMNRAAYRWLKADRARYAQDITQDPDSSQRPMTTTDFGFDPLGNEAKRRREDFYGHLNAARDVLCEEKNDRYMTAVSIAAAAWADAEYRNGCALAHPPAVAQRPMTMERDMTAAYEQECWDMDTESEEMTMEKQWTITLNKYQRDNLAWLIRAIGWPDGSKVEPFHYANTGDWVGEIGWMIGANKPMGSDERPNRPREELIRYIEQWRAHPPAVTQPKCGYVDRCKGCGADLSHSSAVAKECDPNRCAICGWPLADAMEKGCVRGNCSMRPLPERWYDRARAIAENPRLKEFAAVAPKEKG